MTTREAIERIVKQYNGNSYCRLAKVTAVQDYTCTVELVDTETEIFDVQLQADESNGLLLTPAIHTESAPSFVIIAPLDTGVYAVVMYSRLSAIKFLDGSFGGVVKVADLVSKLNAIENKVNSVISFLNSHTHASNGVVAAPPFSGGNLSTTNRGDIENDKVTHGTV